MADIEYMIYVIRVIQASYIVSPPGYYRKIPIFLISQSTFVKIYIILRRSHIFYPCSSIQIDPPIREMIRTALSSDDDELF
jgi:hypothetical protein